MAYDAGKLADVEKGIGKERRPPLISNTQYSKENPIAAIPVVGGNLIPVASLRELAGRQAIVRSTSPSVIMAERRAAEDALGRSPVDVLAAQRLLRPDEVGSVPSKNWSTVHLTETPLLEYGPAGVLTSLPHTRGIPYTTSGNAIGKETMLSPEVVLSTDRRPSFFRMPEAGKRGIVYNPRAVDREMALKLKAAGGIAINSRLRRLLRRKSLGPSLPASSEEYAAGHWVDALDPATTEWGKSLGNRAYARIKSAQESIPPQELSGILNASLAESLRQQREKKIQLQNAIFDIKSYGGVPVDPSTPYSKRREMIQRALKYLPAGRFHEPKVTEDPSASRQMWEDIKSGKNPRTHEGIVATPEVGQPTKVKIMPEYDVTIRGVFPGEGKFTGTHVGGIEYSLPDSDKVVGRVGTGMSDELRRQMYLAPAEYAGRMARIRAQGQYPSGAYRAPALISVHEG
jgi:hypothetical protein